jgi:DNA-binding NarL/FixJ family response regulator
MDKACDMTICVTAAQKYICTTLIWLICHNHPNSYWLGWDLLPIDLGVQALTTLRAACSNAIVVVLISHLDARQQAARSAGADAFISKGDTPEYMALHLRLAAAKGFVQ